MFKEEEDESQPQIVPAGNAEQQVGEMFPELGVNEALFLQLYLAEVKMVEDGGRQVVLQEITSQFELTEHLFEEFVVGIGEFAHGRKV